MEQNGSGAFDNERSRAMNIKFGDKLVRLRKQRGMSQEELAAKLGVSRQAVSKWENDATLPNAQQFLTLCRVLDVDDIAGTFSDGDAGGLLAGLNAEGRRRALQAQQGVSELMGRVDSLLIIPNDRLKYVTDQKITFANAFGIADDVLKQAVTSISELVGYSDRVIINLDFADVSSIMKNAGRAHMGVGIASGREKAEQAAMAAVASPLLETSINGATGVLINVTGAADLGLDDVETAANIVMEAANPEANIIFGATFSEDFEDEMRVTVIATGFDEKKPESKGIYSSSKPAAGSKQQSIPADAASDINDIDEIFKIFNK